MSSRETPEAKAKHAAHQRAYYARNREAINATSRQKWAEAPRYRAPEQAKTNATKTRAQRTESLEKAVKHRQYWTEADIEALKSGKPASQLATELGRTLVAVEKARVRFGIPAPNPNNLRYSRKHLGHAASE